MLIDPSGKNIELNVAEWSSNIVTNEFIQNTDLAGYVHSKYKGSIRKFKCNGESYGDSVTSNMRYLESVSFDDIIEITLNINQDFCDIQTNLETITGFISIETFRAERIGLDLYSYTMEGLFFDSDAFELHQISSYFDMEPVTGSGGSASNQMLTMGLSNGTWGSGGLVVTTGGTTFRLIPDDVADCTPTALVVDTGSNVHKIQLLTYTPDGNLIDISYALVNRGGFKLESNLKWSIESSGYTRIIYNDSLGYHDLASVVLNEKQLGTSLTFIASGVAIISNIDDFYASSISGYVFLKTQKIPGNVITIVGSDASIINGISNGGNIPTGLNCYVDSPNAGENYISSGGKVNIPVQFRLNDGSQVQSIEIFLCTSYNATTWTLSSTIAQVDVNGNPVTVDLDKYRYGGFISCYFPTTAVIKNAGIQIKITYSGWSETVYNPATFSVNLASGGGNAPIAENAALKNIVRDYPIFQISDMGKGIYDLYFFVNVASGKGCMDIALYASSLSSGYSDADIIVAWRTVMDNYFVISNPATIPSMPSYNSYNSIDYGGGGMNALMVDNVNNDPSQASVAIFRRTVLIDSVAGTHVHARIKNLGSGQISGFAVYAVPVFSYGTQKFVGDCANAAAPNVKNSILVPK